MKGYLLLRVYLHIFCSNGDPTKQEGPKRGSIAKINGIQSVTGCQIAYAACQAHYALSSKDGWTEQDGAFDMATFYDSIVALFESYPDDEWALDTLAWWNEEIFGDPNGRTDTDKTQDAHPPESTVAKMAAHREAQAKARAEAAAQILDDDAMATDQMPIWYDQLIIFLTTLLWIRLLFSPPHHKLDCCLLQCRMDFYGFTVCIIIVDVPV